MQNVPPRNKARRRVADFWDGALADWVAGKALDHPDLLRWKQSYQGSGSGEVDQVHYPDPVVGDLRGVRREPRLILLGLNPGIGYDSLQSRAGVWARRIADQGYTYCFDRSPAADPQSWLALHGKESPYWRKAIRFAQRWLEDPDASIDDILNFELYPWHSRSINGVMQPPADLIQRYIWDAVEECAAREVFAFGKEWFKIVQDLGVPRLALYGPDGDPLPGGAGMAHWRIGFYRLTSGQAVIVSAQRGYSGPPGDERIGVLRELLQATTRFS